MNTTSASLLERLRRPGEEEAWARFVDLYTPLLFFWANRLGLPQEDVADLVQDVFLTLVRKLPEFVYDPKKSFRSWLRTILHNRCRDMLRVRKSAPVSHGLPPDNGIPDAGDLEAYWESEYREHLVGRALELIQVDFHETTWRAFWEVVVEGRPPGEVARQFAISVDCVYTAKSRVLRRLRQELDGLLD
jgi:RNA polymerase sigma-70 factor (ECF subfamily)